MEESGFERVDVFSGADMPDLLRRRDGSSFSFDAPPRSLEKGPPSAVYDLTLPHIWEEVPPSPTLGTNETRRPVMKTERLAIEA